MTELPPPSPHVLNPRPNGRARPVALLVRRSLSESPQTVGHQYVFGVVPFTRIQPHRSPNLPAEELVREKLSLAGYDVVLVDAESVQLAATYLRPRIIVTASIAELSVTAYDAIFFRVVSIAGRVEVGVQTALDEHPRIWASPFESSSYRKYAFAQLLSYELERTVREALRPLKFELPPVFGTVPCAHDDQSSLTIASLSVAATESGLKLTREEFSGSPLTPEGLSRAALLGVEQGLAETSLPFALLTTPRSPLLGLQCPLNENHLEVRVLSPAEEHSKVRFVMEARINSARDGKGLVFNCSTEADSSALRPSEIEEFTKNFVSSIFLSSPSDPGQCRRLLHH